MATATRAQRTRAQAPAVQNVALASGRGAVHRPHPVVENAFPACRTGQQTRRATRYTHTTAAITCELCLETPVVDQGAVAQIHDVKPSPRAARTRRNGKAQEQAAQQAAEIIQDETAKVLAKRDDEWASERKPGVSDEDYALAVQVRTLRASGGAWWAIAHAMGLKGSGPNVKTGKTGAAYARRLWERAWGPTYKDTSVPRETNAVKKERALTQPSKPWFAKDATDDEILDAIDGHEITWMCRLAAGDGVVTSIQSAVIKGGTSRIVQGPKGRVVNFFEMVKDEQRGGIMSGPQRSVYVDRIEKVGL